jgi:enterochelin esterase-like enzyme
VLKTRPIFSAWCFQFRLDSAGAGKVADAQYAFMKEHAAAINKNLSSFWIAMGGKEDIAYKNCQAMMEKLKSLGIKFTYSEYPGAYLAGVAQ